MRVAFSSFACAVLALAAPVLGLPILESAVGVLTDVDAASAVDMADVKVLELDSIAGVAKVEVRGLPDELTGPLVFDVFVDAQINTAAGPDVTLLTLNEIPLDLAWDRGDATTAQDASVLNTTGAVAPAPADLAVLHERQVSLSAADHFGFVRRVELAVTGHVTILPGLIEDNDAQEVVTFVVTAVDGFIIEQKVGMDVVMRVNEYRTAGSDARPLIEAVLPIEPVQNTHTAPDAFKLTVFDYDAQEDVAFDGPSDISDEIASLLALEEQASSLQAEIDARKQRLSSKLRQNREQLPLTSLIEQCDGVLCAANVIAQRICDKVGIDTDPSLNYFQANPQEPLKDVKAGILSASSELVSPSPSQSRPKNATSFALPEPVSYTTPTSALMRVLGIIASALGLGTLVLFIHKKCMSPRTRAERAADREERRNARAYRRAARRANFRRRCASLFSSLNCFGSRTSTEERPASYDEKRALILQEAFLEQQRQDSSIAEKGQSMEAEIRELRHAHDIVRRLVRGSRAPSGYAGIPRDPPPSTVPLPKPDDAEHMAFTPCSMRSRASSGTLPSYTSESLPDYTSRPDMHARAHSSEYVPSATPSLTLSTPDSRSRASSMSSSSGLGSGSLSASDSAPSDRIFSPALAILAPHLARSTPGSSVIDTSPRPSRETLRTGTDGCW